MELLKSEEGMLVRSKVDKLREIKVDQSEVTAFNTEISCFLKRLSND